MTFENFLTKCDKHGSFIDILSGIERVAPEIREQMPNREFEYGELLFIASHICSDKPHYKFNLSLNGQVIEVEDMNFKFYPATDEMLDMPIRKFFMKYNGLTEEEIENLLK